MGYFRSQEIGKEAPVEGKGSPDDKRLPTLVIDGYSSSKRKGCFAGFQETTLAVPDDVHQARVGNHMPKMVSNYVRYRKRSRKGQRKRTRYMCAECVPLSIAACFLSFHGK
ncbi:hypothetical protein TNCV_4612401 [Trichonephila clavipes]|nr:hypothetical protein TNCV_4612401 [Trichonephila clavipes]